MIRIYVTRLARHGTRAEQRVLASIHARKLLLWAMREQGMDPADHPLSYTEEGKPYLAHTDVKVSITHSGQWAACALSDTPVGVDLERIRAISEGVWKKVLATSPDEPMGDAHEAIRRWTCYEASLKRLGYRSPLPVGVQFTTIHAIPGYLLTVCGEGTVEPIRFVSDYAITSE